MSHIPGYNPMTDTPVSYPSTYSDARNAAFNSASLTGPIGANLPYPAMEESPQGRGTRGRGRGRGGGRVNKSEKVVKVYTCANKHPVQALKDLRPDAKFEVICQYLTHDGAAIVVTTTIEGQVYQGEGTNRQIAKTIAAHKAVVGMNTNGHEQMALNVDLGEQKKLVMDRITKWQEEQAVREAKKEPKPAQKETKPAQPPAAKKVKNNNGDSSEVNHLTYGALIHRYGPDIVETTTQLEEKNEAGNAMFRCHLIVQGMEFQATATTKKSARNDTVAQAFSQFTVTPPPVVNEKKRKFPTNSSKKKFVESEYIPIEPVELQDKIAKKCWDFVSEQTESIDDTRKSRRNLVCIVKVEGEMDPTLENCEVVAFGNGTLVIKKENMTSDGTAINDCTGESLALRGLRRYLLDQVELCLAGKPSIYIKDRSGGKCSLKKGVKLVMYTNSAPMGDSRCFNSPPLDTTVTDTDAVLIKTEEGATETPMEVSPAPKKKPFIRYRKPRVFKEEDLGKIQAFLTGVPPQREESTQMLGENSHSIVSPSDKLAIRQLAGVQGSVLFSLSQPIYLSQYLINRTFNEGALTRAMFDRVKDAKVANGSVEAPTFTSVKWKATRREERKTPWSLIWAKGHAVEVIYPAKGKQFHIKEGVEEPTPENIAEYLAQSEYCTKSLYTACVNVCKKFKKSYPQKYSVAKYANTRYRTVKNAVISHLKETGMGEWPERTCKPEY